MNENRAPSVGFATVGNALTLSRLVLLPVIIVGITTGIGSLVVAAMAATIVTDLLDGRISRRLGQASRFGGDLDSTVDFVLIYSLFIAFYASGRLLVYQFALIYLAMLTNLMVQLRVMGIASSERIVHTRIGKLTGALEYGYLLFLVAREVLPRTHDVSQINVVFFIILAAAIVLNCGSCILQLRRPA
jgi:phosphatidylglycerophosphate synthase